MGNQEIVLCDCDGVLTDGKLFIDQNGGISKSFHTRDVRAIKEIISMGYEFIIITASSWKGIESFQKKTGSHVIVERNKVNIKFDNYIAIGDDSWDIEMLKKAAIKYCPADAIDEVKNIENIIKLSTNGGYGCIAELLIELKKIN